MLTGSALYPPGLMGGCLAPSLPTGAPLARPGSGSVVVEGPQGIPGPVGPAGAIGPPGSAPTFTAGAALGGHRALMFAPDGTVVYADPSADPYVFAGVSLGAAAPGAGIQAIIEGLILEPTWSWVPLEPVYVGAGGALTQVAPGTGLFHLVGCAVTATSLQLSPAPLVYRQ